jgi:hypothetical protein
MSTTLDEVLAFVEEASYEQMQVIGRTCRRRVALLEHDWVQDFQPGAQVLLSEEGGEIPAMVVKVNRRTVTVFSGGRWIRCSPCYLRKGESAVLSA